MFFYYQHISGKDKVTWCCGKREKIGRDPEVQSKDTPSGMILLLKIHIGTRARGFVKKRKKINEKIRAPNLNTYIHINIDIHTYRHNLCAYIIFYLKCIYTYI